VTQASNVTGAIFPIDKISAAVRRVGALLSVDGSQFIPTHRERFSELGIDFLSFSMHKLGGPTGIGALCMSKEALVACRPWLPGGGTVRSVRLVDGRVDVRYLDGAARHEGGVQDYAGILGAGAAIEFIKGLGYDVISEHVAALQAYARKKLSSHPEVRIISLTGGLDSLLTFCFTDERLSLEDFSIFLNEHPERLIAVRCGHHCAQPLHDKLVRGGNTMRLSFFAYNDFGDIDAFMGRLAEYLEICRS
jgi:cysteine desulfurase/selenocysteine lyase